MGYMANKRTLSLTLGAGIAVLLTACAPLTNASADSTAPAVDTSFSQTTPDTVTVPADATPATGNVLAEIMDAEWVPQPAADDIRLSFAPQGSMEGFRVEGGPCNGYGVAVHPDVETGTYTTTRLPVTRMACDTMAYEGAVTQALLNGDTFMTTDADTLYIAGQDGALKLLRAN